ncbi:hypothetical protein PGT21_036730 [Puccinia graminis f. sp. tritici]|uniref:Uncharacterized protein n=2 Tax=Puccinia graminis f. sp. tritici TaxID=56615 RepID=E3L3B7_PUCGT|nr:uncharacterized protein PGTG_17314 [Puccinia graminis f. sp. tritici CRL 75-36-700-3]EFP91042.2 hypothetical protein PGTG_17314 [Puccinia graminis f. sp. tritici CRL 75-36-700-3]KAA1119981.1 hypothetical protein PGT21_036730 [Puccinia graminis f. sp. tritici]
MQFSKLLVILISVTSGLVLAKEGSKYIFTCDHQTFKGKPAPQAVCGRLIHFPDQPTKAPTDFNLVEPISSGSKSKQNPKSNSNSNSKPEPIVNKLVCADYRYLAMCCHPNTVNFEHKPSTLPIQAVNDRCTNPPRL